MKPFSFGKEEDIDKVVNEEIKTLGDLARACINSEQFQAYKAGFIKVRAKVVEQMANYSEPSGDLQKYGLKMMIYSERLKMLGVLLQDVERDAKKGK